MIQNKISKNTKQGEIIKSQCIECKRETNSEVLYNIRIDGSEEIAKGIEIEWFDDYYVVQCKGCDTISFFKESWFSEDWNPYDGGATYTYYPSARKKVALEIKDLPNKIAAIYGEVIDAYNVGAHLLVAGGLRAMIEAMCSSKGIKNGNVPNVNGGAKNKNNLEGKIHGLMDAGYISLKQVEALHELRFLGNTALHEIDIPTEVQVNIAFSIIESIMEVIYGFEVKSEELRVFREKH